MSLIDNVLYRAHVKATAGRDARAVSSDGLLDLNVTPRRERGGANGRGVEPEHLFAACYAVSFLAMMRLVAKRDGIALPADTEVEAIFGGGPTRRGFETGGGRKHPVP